MQEEANEAAKKEEAAPAGERVLCYILFPVPASVLIKIVEAYEYGESEKSPRVRTEKVKGQPALCIYQ